MTRPDQKFAPFRKDTVCQHQTLFPGMGIEVAGTEGLIGIRMAVGFMRIPLAERYASFRERLSLAIRNRS